MKHLTLKQRYQISALLDLDSSFAYIAQKIGVNRSTITREIKRNCPGLKYYCPIVAHQTYLARKIRVGKIIKVFKQHIKDTIDHLLEFQFSPEQITGFLRRLNIDIVSHTSIYKYIWSDKKNKGTLFKHLRSAKKKKRKKYGTKDNRTGPIKNRVSIEKRPKIVDRMARIGDWEADTIFGKDQKSFIVSLTERRSMFQLIKRVKSKKPKVVQKAITDMIRKSGLPALTMTFDNGVEFANHQKIAKALNLQAFFAHPYSSFERGLNENQNGLVRQYFPKKTDFRNYSQQQVRKVQNLLNIRPRKELQFLSPIEFVNYELGTNLEVDIKTWKFQLEKT